MSAEVKKVLQQALKNNYCDCVVIGITPEAQVCVDSSAETASGITMMLQLGGHEITRAWYGAALDVAIEASRKRLLEDAQKQTKRLSWKAVSSKKRRLAKVSRPLPRR